MADVVERYRIVGENQVGAAFRQILSQSNETANRMGSIFKRAFAGVSLLGVGRAFAQTVEFHDQLARGAVTSGIAAKAYTELAFAARQADVDQTGLATALKKMQVSLSEAGTGSKASLQALEALGIEFRELKLLQPDRQFELIGDSISRLKDPADRTRAAVELFGRAGADLLPMFENGAAGIRKAREEAQRFGQSLNEIDLRKLQEADRSIKQMGESWRGAKTSFAAFAAQDFSEVSDKLAVFFGTSSRIQDLEVRIRDLQREAAKGVPLYFNFGYIDGAPVVMGPDKLAEWIRTLRIEQSKLQTGFGTGIRGGKPFGGGGSTPPPGFESARDAFDKLNPVTVTATKILDDYNQMLKDTETDAQAAARAYDEFRIKLEKLSEAGLIGKDEFNKRLGAYLDDNLQEVEVTARKILPEANAAATSLMATLKDESARRAFGALSDTIAGASLNVRDFASDVLSAFRRILADRVTQDLFAWFAQIGQQHKGGGGLLGALGSGLGWLFGGFKLPSGTVPTVPTVPMFKGYASGGFMRPGELGIVGERGPEWAMAGSRGLSILPMQRGAAPISVTVDARTSIDARGASVDLIKTLPGVLAARDRALSDSIEMRVIEGLRRRRYSL